MEGSAWKCSDCLSQSGPVRHLCPGCNLEFCGLAVQSTHGRGCWSRQRTRAARVIVMKQDEKRELCAACFIYAYQTAEMREAPLCAQCPTALTTRNREDCEAYYGDVGWFETYGEPEGYFCAQCLSNLCCDQLQGRSRDYDFSQMERIWVEYDMWQAYLTGSDQSEGFPIQGGGPRPTPAGIDAKVEEAVIHFGEGGTLEEEAAAAAAEAAQEAA